MLDWMKRRRMTVTRPREAATEAPRPPGRVMSGQYLLLYNYLENRYANTVVLTFAEIEDLLGFTLPDPARVQKEWWTGAEGAPAAAHSSSWTLARRTASPNLLAQTVVFERAAA